MAGLLSSIRTSVTTGYNTFRRVYFDPAAVEGGAVPNLTPSYALLWSYYSNSAFEDIVAWSRYRGQFRLYRQMRLLYNPTRSLCDFYATHIYPGVLAATPTDVPAGMPIAIPLAPETTPAVRDALDQLWAWSRWRVNKSVLCLYGAVAGNVLVEVVDDVDKGRVYAHIVWPSLISFLDLDPTGQVNSYALEYFARGDDGSFYEYRKMVTADTISFFKDDKPFDYGQGASYANPYGFVPAVWIKHKDIGGDYGAQAMYGSLSKIDEVNSLASHLSDQVHKVIGAPLVLWSDGAVSNLFTPTAQTKRGPTQATDPTDLDREAVLLLKGPQGGKVDTLAGQLQLAEAANLMQMLLTEIERDNPEVTMYAQLRKMSQVTGPAATRLMGDVVNAVDEAAANYDEGSALLFAMCLAIGGWRANRGDWGPLSAQQQLFTPFNIDQVPSGELQIRILSRPLIQMSEIEQLELEQLRNSVEAGTPTTLAATLRETVAE